MPKTSAPHKFVVPYKLHHKSGRTKASLGMWLRKPHGGGTLSFEAPSYAAAVRRVEELILPGDERSVRGRTEIRRYEVKEPDARDLVQGGAANQG